MNGVSAPPNITVTPEGFKLGKSTVSLQTPEHCHQVPENSDSNLPPAPVPRFTLTFPGVHSMEICQIAIQSGDVSSTDTSDPRGAPGPVRLRGGPAKQCGVCGDRATGRHYNAMTCEGCKGFFRRYVNTGKSFPCLRGTPGQCTVSKSMRKSCRGCRLLKCLNVGMTPGKSRRIKGRHTPTALTSDDSVSSRESVTPTNSTPPVTQSVGPDLPLNSNTPVTGDVSPCSSSEQTCSPVYPLGEYHTYYQQGGLSSPLYSPGYSIPSIRPLTEYMPTPTRSPGVGGSTDVSDEPRGDVGGHVLPWFPHHDMPGAATEAAVYPEENLIPHYIPEVHRGPVGFEQYGSHPLHHQEYVTAPVYSSELDLIESVLLADRQASADPPSYELPLIPFCPPQDRLTTCKTILCRNISLFSGCVASHVTNL